MDSQRKGAIFAFSQAVLWSLLPVLTVYAFKSATTSFSLAITASSATLFFAIVLSFQGYWHELKIASAYPYILGNTLLNALLFLGIVFWGTSLSSPGNVAIILRMENLFSIMILGGSGFDKITRREVFGGLLMILGAAIVLFPGELSFHKGDVIIFCASCLPVFGNVCSKKARRLVSSATIMFARSLISSLVFWAIALSRGVDSVFELSSLTLLALFINGFFALGLKGLLWIEAINLIPISTANSIGSIAPLCTLFFAFAFLGELPSIWQLTAVVPVVVGLNMLLWRSEGEKGN